MPNDATRRCFLLGMVPVAAGLRRGTSPSGHSHRSGRLQRPRLRRRRRRRASRHQGDPGCHRCLRACGRRDRPVSGGRLPFRNHRAEEPRHARLGRRRRAAWQQEPAETIHPSSPPCARSPTPTPRGASSTRKACRISPYAGAASSTGRALLSKVRTRRGPTRCVRELPQCFGDGCQYQGLAHVGAALPGLRRSGDTRHQRP